MRSKASWRMGWRRAGAALAALSLALAPGGWSAIARAEEGSTITEQDLPPAEPAAQPGAHGTTADEWPDTSHGTPPVVEDTAEVRDTEAAEPRPGAADKVEGSMEHAGEATKGGVEKAGAATGRALDKAITKTGEGIGYVIDKTGKGLKSAGEALSGER